MVKKPAPPELDRFQQDLQREKQKQKQLEKEMKKQRVRQLKAANEEEDKMIRKLEKQLKIDKTRSQKYVPKMFNDGLEYALELCLPENIQKMYTAAKEAAEQDADSDSGFQEDMAIATKTSAVANEQRNKRKLANDKSAELPAKKKAKAAPIAPVSADRLHSKMAKLKQMESKYFDTDEELDSDLSGNDSEFEQNSSDDEVLEVHNKQKRKQQMAVPNSDDDDFDVDDDDVTDEDDEDEENTDDSDVDSVSGSSEASVGDSSSAAGKFVKKPLSDSAEELDDNDEGNSDDGEPTKNATKGDIWEDIYGRSRDKAGNVLQVSFVRKT